MNGQIKAKPTEYKGFLYRSRAQAKFACALDHWLQYVNEGAPLASEWKPEPNLSGGWNPDFEHSLGANRTVIEYKPSEPTEAYASEFYESFRGHNSHHKEHDDHWVHFAVICFGNFFNEDYGAHVFCHERGLMRTDRHWLGIEKFKNVADNWRYDLK